MNPQTSQQQLQHTIHVGTPFSLAATLEEQAGDVGLTVVHLDVFGVASQDRLVARIADLLSVPFFIHGLDAVVSVLGDLEWLALPRGILLMVHGLDDAHPALVDDLVGILPNAMDRLVSGGQRCAVVLIGHAQAERSMSVLTTQQALMDHPPAYPGVERYVPVAIIEHSGSKASQSPEADVGG